ncbi:uncharacterized protein ACNLHF_009249 [Anomaloglossus baeobatrachus]
MQLCNFHNLRFQELFTQYTAEPRDSENRRRYEQEIREMERQRGYDVRLILTKPWHVLRTIVNGRHKAYVNMCSSRALKKPYRPTAADRARQMYRQWSLHYVTNPARQELDRDRCRVLIYDVAFHPDTLHRASRSLSFRSHVDLTALHSVAQQYHVHVDTRNVQIMRCKYMGRRQPTFYRTLLPLPLPKPQGVTGSLQKSKTTLPPGEAGDSRASPLETTLPPGEASDSRASPLETTLPPGEASDSRASPLETTLPPGEASDSRASPLETTLSPEEASDSRASPLETTLPPREASDSRASTLETTLPPGEAGDSRASALETTLSPEEASDSRASPLETTLPPGEASDSRASALETTLSPEEASDSRASTLETTLPPGESGDSRASPLETTLPPGEASDSRASSLETTLPPGEASDSRASPLETTLPPTAASDSRASPLETTLPPGEASDSRASPLETTLSPEEASDSRASPLETTLPPREASDSRASTLETTLPPGEAGDSRASALETTLSPEEASDSRASPLETTLPPGEASDSRASALETTLSPEEASDSRASALETTLSPEEASDSRASTLETTLSPEEASDSRAFLLETTLPPTAASDHSPSPLETTVPHYTIRHRSFFSLQDYRNPRDSAPSPVPQELVITVYLPLLKEESAIVLQIHPKDLSLESYNPAYKLQLDLPYLVEDGRHVYDYDTTKKQLLITLPVVQQDLPSLMPTPPPAKEDSPKPNRTTRDAEKTPPNSIFTCSQDATTVTLFIHMKDIDQHSVTCEVRFCVKTSNAPCVLFVAFQPQYGLNTDEIDVNMSTDNMVLKLTKSTANFRPWKSLYFGVNSNTLQERSFSNEKNMAANRLPPSTMPWATQINVLEMTDRRTHIRLKIYVEEEHLLTEEEQHWGLSGLLSLRSSHSDSTSQSDTSETSEESRQSPHLPMGCPTSPPAQPSAQRTHTDHPAEEDEGLCTHRPPNLMKMICRMVQSFSKSYTQPFHTDRVLYDVACSDSSALFFSDHRTLCLCLTWTDYSL